MNVNFHKMTSYTIMKFSEFYLCFTILVKFDKTVRLLCSYRKLMIISIALEKCYKECDIVY